MESSQIRHRGHKNRCAVLFPWRLFWGNKQFLGHNPKIFLPDSMYTVYFTLMPFSLLLRQLIH